ncbi:hypothetical protein [Microbacterium enclense]|uniref:hypothetical protein n=1 Tax=Microbacterium enclense TaxID=993073 RepID=UPI0034302B3E
MNEDELVRASLELEAAFLDDLGEPDEAARVRARVPVTSTDATQPVGEALAPRPNQSDVEPAAKPVSGAVQLAYGQEHGATQDVVVSVNSRPSEHNTLAQPKFIRVIKPLSFPATQARRKISAPRFGAAKVDLELMHRLRDQERARVEQVVGTSAFWTAVSGGVTADGGSQGVTQQFSRPAIGLTERPKETA